MKDHNDGVQEVEAQAFGDIPTFEEHNREIRRLWAACIAVASFLFIGLAGGLIFLFARQTQLAIIVLLSTLAFQVVGISYGVGFLVPAAMTSIRRLSLSLQMGYQGLRMTRTMTGEMKDLIGEVKPIMEVANRVVKDGYFEKIEGHMAAIRKAIERQAAPVKPLARETVEER